MQKRNKIKSKIDPDGQTVIVIDDEEETMVKRKHLEKGKAADHVKTKKKKDSKLKKGQADHLIIQSGSDLKLLKEADKIIIESSSDSESIKETGKAPKMKMKRSRGFCHEQGRNHEVPTEAHQEIHSLSRKTCKKSIPVSHGDNQGFATKKKKKKRKHQPSYSVMVLQSEDNENESTEPFSKKPKLISQEGVLLSENKIGHIVKKKHKGICCLVFVDNQGSSNGIGDEEHAGTVSQLKSEHICQGRGLDCRQHHENGVENEMTPKKKKTKRKKWRKKEKLKAQDAESVLAVNQEGDSEDLLGTKCKREIVDTEDITSLMQDTEGVHQATKKKKIQAKAENDCPAPVEGSGGMATNGKEVAVKRKKKKRKAQEEPVHSDPGGFTEENELRVWKRKKSDSSREEPHWRRAKLKEQTKEREEEIEVVAFKKGNCDEASIDMLRQQALQEEIDRESGKMMATKEEEKSDAQFGQWSTATFESQERKNKFLRLLGGFKNSSASAHSSPAHTTKPNMALARAGEKQLLQNLQTEFDKARDLKQFRGVGLGFQPTTQKHMYIDKYASKSIKFES